MSVISGVREFVQTCPSIGLLKSICIDSTEDDPTSYGISPAGDRLVSAYIDGSQKRQYSFAVYVRRATLADVERLDNAEFVEGFCDWVDQCVREKNFPSLGDRITVTGMETANGFLFDLDEDGMSGLYQIQCQLYYTKRI